jgi:hypothetical protein
MGKVTRKGIAPPDDPIYKEGWSVSVPGKKLQKGITLIKIHFRELYNALGAFGNESVSPGGACFPKYLLQGWNIRKKFIILPSSAKISHGKDTLTIRIGDSYVSVICKKNVRKIDYITVSKEKKSVKPLKGVAFVTLMVHGDNENPTSYFLSYLREKGYVLAFRSKATTLTVMRDRGKQVIPQQMYEIAIQTGAEKLLLDGLRDLGVFPNPDNPRYAFLISNVVYPDQLKNLKR